MPAAMNCREVTLQAGLAGRFTLLRVNRAPPSLWRLQNSVVGASAKAKQRAIHLEPLALLLLAASCLGDLEGNKQ